MSTLSHLIWFLRFKEWRECTCCWSDLGRYAHGYTFSIADSRHARRQYHWIMFQLLWDVTFTVCSHVLVQPFIVWNDFDWWCRQASGSCIALYQQHSIVNRMVRIPLTRGSRLFSSSSCLLILLLMLAPLRYSIQEPRFFAETIQLAGLWQSVPCETSVLNVSV